MCRKIEETVKAAGRSLSDYSPEEFMEMMQTLY
jgi:hypothetical protein